MPRSRGLKTDKLSLQFQERPVCGARLHDGPEVRAALNPKDFFSETQKQNSSTLNSWVNPQFDCSIAAAPPVRRGRRKWQSSSSILDKCSQLSRKNGVCKFPALTFQTGTRKKFQKPVNKCTKKGAESTVLSKGGSQPQGSGQRKRAILSAHCSDIPKRPLSTIRKGNAGTITESATSHVEFSDQHGIQSKEVGNRCRIPAEGALTPVITELSTTEVSSVRPQLDVDSPKIMEGGGRCPSPTSGHLLLAQPCTPPYNEPPGILVGDTPERDYGVKVTWRRRKYLMLMLKERGHLSDSDALIHS